MKVEKQEVSLEEHEKPMEQHQEALGNFWTQNGPCKKLLKKEGLDNNIVGMQDSCNMNLLYTFSL